MQLLWLGFGILGLILVAVTLTLKRDEKGREWKLLAFLSYFVFPVLFSIGVIEGKFQQMKKVEFCGSCHTMTDHILSLTIDDDEPLSTVHFRNNYVPQETACFSCHTDYAMFGSYEAKIRGLRHIWAYLTKCRIDSLKLYKPYNNRNCLHCHENSVRFRKNKHHRKTEKMLARLASGEVSCLDAGCHDEGHYIESDEDEDS